MTSCWHQRLEYNGGFGTLTNRLDINASFVSEELTAAVKLRRISENIFIPPTPSSFAWVA